jgi:glycogen synthase
VTNINNCGVLTSTVVIILVVGASCKKKQKKTADQLESKHHLVILAHARLNAFLDSDAIHYACDLLLHPISYTYIGMSSITYNCPAK